MKNVYLLILSSVALFGFASPGRAAEINTPDFLLIVDDSNPGAVTFTATINDPLNSDTTHFFYDGIDLMTFLTAPAADLPANLTPTVTGAGLTTFVDGTPQYANSSYFDHVSGTEVDFNLYARTFTSATTTETFDSTQQAFTGTDTVDLSDYESLLPAFGATGEIFAGYSGENDPNDENPLVFLGDYEVIPEPSQWSLLLVGAAGLIYFRRLHASRAG